MPSDRGPHPEDEDLFAPDEWPRLRAAVRDLSWLRSRGYGPAAKKLVGDRYRLKRRQRDAVGRSSCTEEERAHRLEARLSPDGVAGRSVEVDTFNALITVEAALGGAYLFVGRDTAYRDVNPVRGTYRVVRQTDRAIELLVGALDGLGVGPVTWYLDDSVSNVGRVTKRLEEEIPARRSWRVRQTEAVDERLRTSRHLVVTSDSDILNSVDAWLHLEALILARHVDHARLVDLRPDDERTALPTD